MTTAVAPLSISSLNLPEMITDKFVHLVGDTNRGGTPRLQLRLADRNVGHLIQGSVAEMREIAGSLGLLAQQFGGTTKSVSIGSLILVGNGPAFAEIAAQIGECAAEVEIIHSCGQEPHQLERTL